MRSFCSGHPGSIILGHGHNTLPAYREGLTYRVFSAEQGKSVSLPYGVVKAASPLKRRSQGLSCVIGNFHAQFLEGWTGAIPSGYSVNFQVRFLGD